MTLKPNLVVYVDGAMSGELPWVAKIQGGELTDSVSVKEIAEVQRLEPVESTVEGDPYSSDPAVMEGVIRYVFNKYPSRLDDYALLFWGHGNGWQINDSIPRNRAYGIDNGRNNEGEMDTLADATKTVLQRMAPKFEGTYPDMTGLVYYYYYRKTGPHFYDANDFVLKFAEPDDYAAWKQALNKAVVYMKMSTMWMTEIPFRLYYAKYFTVTEEKYGGVSMFVPTSSLQETDNLLIWQMGWYKAAGYDTIGW